MIKSHLIYHYANYLF